MTIKLLDKTYSDESLADLFNDIDVVYEDHSEIEKDEFGFRKGQFKVIVEWSPIE
ncbi:hypothetical protein D3C80_2156340 [compost metagenome]